MIPGGWECVVVSGATTGGVCPRAGVLLVDAVVSGGQTVALLVASGVVGLLVVTPGTVRLAVALGRWLVVVAEVGGMGRGPKDMVSRIQPFSLVMRAYTPGFLAWAQPMPQLTMPAK
jgi:hypothetical protein